MRIRSYSTICVVFLLCFVLANPSLAGTEIRIPGQPEVQLVYATSGIMPQLLNTSQIDAFFVWESVVSTAEMGGIGKIIARDADIPPDGTWTNTACNVLVMRNGFITEYPEIAALLSAVLIAGTEQIHEDPDLAIPITAEWVYGSKPIRSAGLSLSPLDVERHAFPHIQFTSNAALPVLNRIFKPSFIQEATSKNPDPVYNTSVYNRSLELLNGSEPAISKAPPVVRIGYLPSADLYAPLYVTIMEHKKICNRYGFCLAPVSDTPKRPVECELIVHNTSVADVRLLPGQVGGGVMTGLGQNAIDVACIGSVPALMQISMGNPASIIQSINAGGSGLVVDDIAPCTDWSTFLDWVRSRSSDGHPVILAVPQSSIQEEMIRGAFEYEGIPISLYGLPGAGIH